MYKQKDCLKRDAILEKKYFDQETKEQFRVMLIILVVVCAIFTAVYFLRPKTDVAADSPVTKVSDNSEPKESKSESSKKTESAEVKVQPPPKLDGTQQAIKLDNSEIYKGSLILVNKDYPSRVDGIDPVSLFEYKTDTYGISDSDVLINRSIIETTNKMFDDYYDIYGENDIFVACAYRSYETQQALYDEELSTNPENGTELVAPPGYSDHQTGYVFDLDRLNADTAGIGFDGTGDSKWFLDNCASYGFIVRYPEDKVNITKYEYEPWHYRYVGIPHALYMKQNNLCLEEYIEQIKNNSKDNPLTISSADGTTWSMWYEKAYEDGDVTQFAIPKDCDYEISGNNVDGFIVTVRSSGN